VCVCVCVCVSEQHDGIKNEGEHLDDLASVTYSSTNLEAFVKVCKIIFGFFVC
jgi:hypothetical protein